MKVHIDLVGQQVLQGTDCPYKENIDIALENNVDDYSVVIITIDRKEYFINKNELTKAIDILDKEEKI